MIVRYWPGTTAELHALPMPTEGEQAELWVMQPRGPSLAMGSSQRPERFDQTRLRRDGVELAPRRSGGGAVFIDPTMTVWIDLLAPRSSPWWSNELATTFLNVGRVWQQTLQSFGVQSELVASKPERTAVSTLACWAGAGWGELVIGGAKVVGLSQRRTRWGARVQAMAVLDDSATRVSQYVQYGADPALDIGLADVRRAISAGHALALACAGVTAEQLQAAVIARFEDLSTALGSDDQN